MHLPLPIPGFVFFPIWGKKKLNVFVKPREYERNQEEISKERIDGARFAIQEYCEASDVIKCTTLEELTRVGIDLFREEQDLLAKDDPLLSLHRELMKRHGINPALMKRTIDLVTQGVWRVSINQDDYENIDPKYRERLVDPRTTQRDIADLENKIKEEKESRLKSRTGRQTLTSESALRELKESIAEGDFIVGLFEDHPYFELEEDTYVQVYRFLKDRVKSKSENFASTVGGTAVAMNPKAKERNYRITLNRVLARAHESGKTMTPSSPSLIFSFDPVPEKLNLKRYYALSVKPTLNGRIVPFRYSMLQATLVAMVYPKIVSDALMPIVDLVRMKEIFVSAPLLQNGVPAVLMFSEKDVEAGDDEKREAFATKIAERMTINLRVHVVSKVTGRSGQMSYISSQLYRKNLNSNSEVDVLFFEYIETGPLKTMIRQCEPLRFSLLK